jgi:hypothetical protein
MTQYLPTAGKTDPMIYMPAPSFFHRNQHAPLRNSYVKTLQHILPNIPDNGTIDSWLPLEQNREQWKSLGTEWIKHQQALTIYQYCPHPLLGDGILDHQFFWYLQDIHRRFSMNSGHV